RHWSASRAVAPRALSDCEALLVQQLAVHAADFHSPVPDTVNRLPAVGAITLCRVGMNWQLHGLLQCVSAIPAMHDCGIARGSDTRIKNEPPLRHRVACRIASPATAARRKGPAQLDSRQANVAR